MVCLSKEYRSEYEVAVAATVARKHKPRNSVGKLRLVYQGERYKKCNI